MFGLIPNAWTDWTDTEGMDVSQLLTAFFCDLLDKKKEKLVRHLRARLDF